MHTENAALASDLMVLQARVATLQDGQAELASERGMAFERGAVEADGMGARDAPAQEEPEEPQEIEQRAQAQVHAQLALLDEQIAAEDTDEAWAPEAEASLYQHFDAELPPAVRLDEAACRATFCRLQLGFDADSDRQSGLREVTSNFPWNVELFFHLESGDATGAVVYAARAGHRLPRAPEVASAGIP